MKNFFFVLLLLAGCSTSFEATRFQKADKISDVDEKWSLELPGLATDLSLAKETKHILVGVIPDYDKVVRPISKPHIVLYSKDGKELWRNPLGSKVKSQAISDDAKLVVTSTYDNQLTAYNSQGKKLWSKKDFCQPHVMTQTKKVICYYDDDSHPKTAFSVYTWKGKRIKRYKTEIEVLDLSYSPDEKWMVLSFVGGVIKLLDSKYQVTWKNKLPGEAIQIEISNESSPKIAVLYNESYKLDQHKRTRQKVAIYSFKGKKIKNQKLDILAGQMKFSDDSKKLYFYGNHSQGQILASMDTDLKMQWTLSDGHHADYGSLLRISKDEVIVGFEDVTTDGKSNSYLFGFNSLGKVKWQIPLRTQEGAYLYSNRFTSQDRFIALVTDEGDMKGYEIEN